jgi:hypothetical protein
MVSAIAFIRRGRVVMLLTLAICAIPSPSRAGLVAVELWKTKTIAFVICSSAEPDKSDKRGCGAMRKLDAPTTSMVRAAIAQWNATFAGHIEFREAESYSAGVLRIEASKLPGSCSASQAGYVQGANPVVDIGTRCALQETTRQGSVLHELGHIVGLHHEQRRPDRDDYIELDLKWLGAVADSSPESRGWAYQYTKLCDAYSSTRCTLEFALPHMSVLLYQREYGVPYGKYDFGSIMAYSLVPPDEHNFSTIGVTVAGALRLRELHMSEIQVGQRDGFSPEDIETIKHFYPKQ